MRLIRLATATFLLFSLFSSQKSVAAPVPDCIGGPKSPENYIHSSFFAKRVDASGPEIVTFRSGGPVFIHLSPTGRGETGKVKILLTLSKTDASDEVEVCSTDWLTIPELATTFSTPPEASHDGIWKLTILTDTIGPATSPNAPPYSLHCELATPPLNGNSKITFLGSVPPARSFGDNVESRDFSTCAPVNTPLAPNTETAAVHSFTDQGQELPHVYYVQAARQLYVSISSRTVRRMRITLSAKEAGFSPFASICQVDAQIPASQDGITFLGEITWDRLMNPVWRVEVTPLAPTKTDPGTSQSQFDVKITRNKDEHIYVPVPLYEHFPASIPTAFVCRNSHRKMPVTQQAPSSVVPPTAVFINVPTSTDPNQIVYLQRAASIAVALWTAECATCPIDALAVLRVGDKFLIRTELLQAIDAWQKSPLYPLLADKRISSFRVLIGQGPLFTEVTVNDPRIQKLCVASPQSLPDPLERIAATFGCRQNPNAAAKSVLHLILNVTRGPTACGDSANIVACEPDRELLEFNGRDYAFTLEDDLVVFGNGSARVDLFLVILHEVGHWFGLTHVTTAGSVMSEFLQQARCINDGDLLELSDALGTPNRYTPLTKRQALLATPPK